MIRQALQSAKRATVRTILGGTLVVGAVEASTHLPSQGKSSELYHKVADGVVTPMIRRLLDPEVAHNVALEMAQRGFAPRHHPSPLESRVSVQSVLKCTTTPSTSSDPKGADDNSSSAVVFPNPIGLAAGFDKDGQTIQPLLDMGFGSVEIGTVTPQPQPGNPRPRMFRLVNDHAIINRYGFNSQGADAVEQHLRSFRQAQQSARKEPSGGANSSIWSLFLPPPRPNLQGLVGVNIGKNKTTEDAKTDYVANIQKLGQYADYLVINISSPNTPNLRDLQQADPLKKLVQACLDARNQLSQQNRPPLLVKLAPDLSQDELKTMIPILMQVDGVVVTNTTNQRPESLLSLKHVDELGGLSGAPLKDKSTEFIRSLYKLSNGELFIIGVGGIENGHDAYEKLKAGASVVQIYSSMVYHGPGVVSRVRHELADLMLSNGQRSLEDVIGRDHDDIYWKKRQDRRLAQTSKESSVEQIDYVTN